MRLRLALLLAMVLVALPVPQPLRAAPTRSFCFVVPDIYACVHPAFQQFWQQSGGLSVFGYPLTGALPEEIPGGQRTIQDFERYRLELHPEAPAPYTIQLGRLGADRRAQLGLAPAAPTQPAPGCRFFAETQQNVCGSFLTYWQAHGLEFGDRGVSARESLALLGLPLSAPSWETNAAGDRVLTQWFERARLEDHNGTIRQGLLNIEVQTAQRAQAATPGFAQVAGSNLVQNGQPLRLKGLNYYPAAQPWSHMWTAWDGPTVERELARARRELGINTVRILVPYRRIEDWTDGSGNVRPYMLDRLRQFVQIAGQQQIKVLITLFDWHDSIAPAGSPDEATELRYVRTIVGAFKDDDRVLAWDIHNEPDNYPLWLGGQASAVVGWLGRMADAIRTIDANHPITIGVGRAASLWQAGPDGRTIADISDFLSVHTYDTATLPTLVGQVRQKSTKPLLLEEFGWASGPECRGAYFDENSQLYAYRQAMDLARQDDLIGVMGWWFQDPPATLSYSVDENGYYGLYNRDGYAKPAVGPFRALAVPALPSTATSDLPLTSVTPPPMDPTEAPLVFDTGLVLREQFKLFWQFFGGEETFGKPITNAYRDYNNKVVQYFERARFELNESEHVKPIDPNWPEGQTPEVYLDRVRLAPLGQEQAGSRDFPAVADPQQPGVRYFQQTGHTLRGAFLKRWEQWGKIFFGPPISEPFTEVIDGQPTTVQYFAYWRFEQQSNGPVRFAKLGVPALAQRQCPRPY